MAVLQSSIANYTCLIDSISLAASLRSQAPLDLMKPEEQKRGVTFGTAAIEERMMEEPLQKKSRERKRIESSSPPRQDGWALKRITNPAAEDRGAYK